MIFELEEERKKCYFDLGYYDCRTNIREIRFGYVDTGIWLW